MAQTAKQPVLCSEEKVDQQTGLMGRESLQGSAGCPEEDDAEEFRRILQSDDIAPVDEASYATRLVEIILRALKHKLPWSQD